MPFRQAKKTVGAQCLHQSLHRAELENFAERARPLPTALIVMRQQFLALGRAEARVGIEQKRREIILRQPRAHPLEVDEISLAIAHDDVLRLEIAMDQHRRKSPEALRFPSFASEASSRRSSSPR